MYFFEVVIAMMITAIVSIIGFGQIEKISKEKAAQEHHCEHGTCVDNKSHSLETKTLPAKPVDVVNTAPVTSVVVEKHYDLKELNDGLMAVAGLGGFALLVFIIYKCFGIGRRTLMLTIARKKSIILISAFDSIIDDVKHCLEHNNKIMEQTCLNNLLIELNKENPSMNCLILSNQIMKDQYNFIERKILNDFKK
jgi:hypothetical protein